MTNQEILTKAIEKAVAGGWKDPYAKYDDNFRLNRYQADDYRIIFNHDFAKTLWGETQTTLQSGYYHFPGDGWKFHLQRMVIADDPIEYLGRHI